MKNLKILAIMAILMILPCCSNKKYTNFNTSLCLKSRTIPVVDVRIGEYKIPMVIDTGSEITIVDNEVYEKVPQFFNVGDTVIRIINTLDGQTEQRLVSALTFVNDSIKTNLYIMDIDNVCETIFIKEGIIVKGIIGCDFLYENGLTIDFKNKRLKYID